MLLVGDAAYYGRFGFSAERTGGLWLPGLADQSRLLGCELSAGALDGAARRDPRAEAAREPALARRSAAPLPRPRRHNPRHEYAWTPRGIPRGSVPFVRLGGYDATLLE